MVAVKCPDKQSAATCDTPDIIVHKSTASLVASDAKSTQGCLVSNQHSHHSIPHPMPILRDPL